MDAMHTCSTGQYLFIPEFFCVFQNVQGPNAPNKDNTNLMSGECKGPKTTYPSDLIEFENKRKSLRPLEGVLFL